MFSGFNNFVSTKDGIVPITKIENQEIVIHTDDTDDLKVSNGLMESEDTVYTLKLKDGRIIEATANQKFMYYCPDNKPPFEWKELVNLKEDDEIILSGWQLNAFKKPSIQDSFISYLTGIIQASRNCKAGLEIYRAENNLPLLKDICKYWYLAFDEQLEARYTKSDISLYAKTNSKGIQILKEIIGDNKEVPEYILKINLSAISSYLRGFINGCVKQQLLDDSIALFISRFVLTHQLQFLFDRFDIKSRIDYSNLIISNDFGTKLDVPPFHKPNVWLSLFSNITNNYSLYNYSNLMFMDNHNYSTSQILDITRKGNEKVYAIDISDSYDINGIIVKN